MLFKREKKIESNVIDQLSRKQLILHRELKKLFNKNSKEFFRYFNNEHVF